MLARLVCAPLTPWGEVDSPLTWRADDVDGKSMGEVSVAHDATTLRVGADHEWSQGHDARCGDELERVAECVGAAALEPVG